MQTLLGKSTPKAIFLKLNEKKKSSLIVFIDLKRAYEGALADF